MPERALTIRFKLVFFFGVADHSLRIIHDNVAVGEATLQHQAVMDMDVVVDAAVVSSAVLAKRTVPFRYHLGIHLLVPLTYRLVLVEGCTIQSLPTCPSGCCHPFGSHTGIGAPGRLS